jgi:four helix bundle protein
VGKGYTSFEDMSVWKKAMSISADIFTLTDTLPRKEDYGLTSQIRRSSNSISANIAEGFGRTSNKEKIYFYTNSRGSAFETINHLLYGKNVGYFHINKTEALVQHLYEVIEELNKMIRTFITRP